GFIGCNAVKRYTEAGHEAVIVDNLSRRGAQQNLRWLEQQGRFKFYDCDVRNGDGLAAVVRENKDVNLVLHLAGQVAVTASVLDPRQDFEANALGTLNLLEAVREFAREAIVLYASTNKVYGSLKHLSVIEKQHRYQFLDRPAGISENEPLDFHSPYGCSKGAGD